MSEKFYKNLGVRIKEFREEMGFSQEKLADSLGISRVALSQIENGERKISAEELSTLSKIFNIPSDNLLDLKAQVTVELEKAGTAAIRVKPEMRINVPQKKMKKFKEALLYILNKIGSKANIGETVVYKLLYFADFDFYEKYEEQLIGATYIKNHYGPTPIEFKKIIEEMQGKDLVKVQNDYFNYPQTKYLPLREPNLSEFKAHEIKVIDEVIEKLSHFNANEISEYSHQDVPWLTTQNGEVIDYESVFYRTKPYSVRSYSEEIQ